MKMDNGTAGQRTQQDLLTFRAVIAIGSNLGDRFFNIELALRLLEEPTKLFSSQALEQYGGNDFTANLVDTSFLYETAPMYVTDQPSFVNCACIVRSTYSFLVCQSI